MRWCRHFPAGRQREHLKDLTHFVQQVRIMLDEVARKKGRARMILGHRVPVTLDECLNIGCDVETWAKQRLCGFPRADGLPRQRPEPADRRVREGRRGHRVPRLPGVRLDPITAWDTCTGTERASEGRWPCARSTSSGRPRPTGTHGAPAAARASTCTSGRQRSRISTRQAIAILSSPQKAFAGPRHYVYLPAWKDVTNFDPTGRHNAQSLTFGADTVGKRQVFTFRMADGRNGEKLSGLLRFRIYDATAGDEFAVDLNGRAIPTQKFRIQHQPQGEEMEEPHGPIGRSVRRSPGRRTCGSTWHWPTARRSRATTNWDSHW